MMEKKIVVSILNAGGNIGYLYGLLLGLNNIKELEIDLIDGEKSKNLFNSFNNINFLNLRGEQNHLAPLKSKIIRISRIYIRSFLYKEFESLNISHFGS